MESGTLQDNLLFGRIASDEPDAFNRVQAVVSASLRELDLDREVNRLGLSYEVGPSGRFLPAEQRASLALARALLPKTAIVVIDGAFGSFSAAEGAHMLSGIRKSMAGRTLVVSLPNGDLAETFDTLLVFDGPTLAEHRLGQIGVSAPAAIEKGAVKPALLDAAMT
jgi:ABC-type multidrug transport system fused ATPase/permease subunit